MSNIKDEKELLSLDKHLAHLQEHEHLLEERCMRLGVADDREIKDWLTHRRKQLGIIARAYGELGMESRSRASEPQPSLTLTPGGALERAVHLRVENGKARGAPSPQLRGNHQPLKENTARMRQEFKQRALEGLARARFNRAAQRDGHSR